jgi:PAS domain S-box-containing protein
MLTLDDHARIVSVNDKFCQVFQYSREELLGADARLLHAAPYPQDQLADALQALKDGEAWTDVVSAWRRDGQEVRLRVTASADTEQTPPQTIVVGSVLQALKKPL